MIFFILFYCKDNDRNFKGFFLSNFLFMSNFENKKIINLNGPFLVSRTGDMEKTKKDINIFIFIKRFYLI